MKKILLKLLAITVVCIILYFNFSNILYFFGLNIFFLPVLYFINKKYIVEFILMSYIIDLLNLFSFSFCGSLGELIWKLNYYSYSIGIFCLIGVFLYFIYNRKNKEIFDDRNVPVKTNQSLENTINKILIKYNIPGYVDKVKEGPFITRYFLVLDTQVSKLRFEGLSREFSQELQYKVMNCYTFSGVYIDVENLYKNAQIFKEVFYIKQPNHLSLCNATGEMIQINYLRNIYICANELFVNSILTNMLVTQVGTDVIMFQTDFIQFSTIHTYIDNNIQEYLLEIINEINRRYTIILPYGRTMDEYESVDHIQILCKFPRKILIIFQIDQLDKQIIEYITKYGENVGIYIHNININKQFDEIREKSMESLFKIKFFGPQNKDIIMNDEVLRTGLLCDIYDCFFVNQCNNVVIRLGIPKTTTSEQCQIMLFHRNLHPRSK